MGVYPPGGGWLLLWWWGGGGGGGMAAILKIVGSINTLCGQDVEFLEVARVGHALNSGHLTVGTCEAHHC